MRLAKKVIAIAVADFYQPLEYWYPYMRMIEEGAVVKQISREPFHTTRHGYASAPRDLRPEEARAHEFDALLIPGGFAPDALRRDTELLRFVREMDREKRLIAAICHGPWVAVSAEIVRGRRVTCFPSIRDDVINAGARYIDCAAVRDGNLITGRGPHDLPDFCREIVDALSGGGTNERAGV
jgi:protease I